MTLYVEFEAWGVPVPQGSKKLVQPRGHKRPMLIDVDKVGLDRWRGVVGRAARNAMGPLPPLDGPVGVHCLFTVPHPPSRAKRDQLPDRKPDIDKLLRAVFDALTGIVMTEDSRVVESSESKRYPNLLGGGAQPGVQVRVYRLDSE